MKTTFVYTFLFCAIPLKGIAQDDFDSFKKRMETSYNSFKKEKQEEYDKFRKRINDEYAAMLEKVWKEFASFGQKEVPEDKIKPIPPVIFPKDDKKKPKPQPLPYEEIVPVPQPKPQPEPVVPIEESPQPVAPVVPKESFTLFGTPLTVRFDKSQKINLNNTNEQEVAKAWKAMSTENYTNLIYDCLEIRRREGLCDWAYLEMIKSLSEQLYGKDTNASTLLMAYIYCQSGYKMRLARSENNKLHMMFASEHIIYKKNYFVIDDLMYYPYGESLQRALICDATFPKEKSMSLYIPQEQRFSERLSPTKTRKSERYPEVCTSMASNLNLMDFYSTYPTSMIGDNMVSRWAMYANTPMNSKVKQQIYPALQSAIKNCNQLTAVNKLLNFVQTAFVYEYDDKVWGGDRAFFPEETLYYPYCDCEDRSILFTRLVRDLLGLKCILIYYPGHLASAVCFTENVSGDYIDLNHQKFIVCDPTYIGAPVGRTMPDMDNAAAKVILLE